MDSGRNTAITLSAVCLLTACGDIKLGAGTVNDAEPSGTVVAQGNFTGQNGRSVSGVAMIYSLSSGSSCIHYVRLVSLSAPSDATLQVIPIVNGAASVSPTFYTLRGATGNHTYAFTGAPCGSNWVQVQIANPALNPPSAQNYGIATLISP